MARSKYIEKPISDMSQAERIGLADNIVSSCTFELTDDEKVSMIAAMVVAMDYMNGL